VYSTCIFCHSNLGKNESVEHFPIGRRLAFDAAHGRLWVVCRKCERWNLTPLEERWEAIEECERLFSGTKLRVSTDHIGLARLRDGLELVRIGEPQRPELAAWRYGDQFGRRRRRNLVNVAALSTVGIAVGVLGPTGGIAASVVALGFQTTMFGMTFRMQRRRLARVRLPDSDRSVDVVGRSLRKLSIAANGDDWSLVIPYEKPRPALGKLVSAFRPPDDEEFDLAVLTGDEALRVAAKLLPVINLAGGKATEVSSAVDLIERSDNPHALFNRFVVRRKIGYGKTAPRVGIRTSIIEMPAAARLALEMVSHEDAERRALEGELQVLEAAWKEAEEIAAIADDLLTSPAARQRLDAMKDDRQY
jgi:hypothetical protein